MKRPNFLFFITDQHRADYLGCSGHPIVKTPNIDVIAARGVRFDNFHVATPVCMPNRASLLTGRFPSAHGLRYNGGELSYREFPDLFLKDFRFLENGKEKLYLSGNVGTPDPFGGRPMTSPSER